MVAQQATGKWPTKGGSKEEKEEDGRKEGRQTDKIYDSTNAGDHKSGSKLWATQRNNPGGWNPHLHIAVVFKKV